MKQSYFWGIILILVGSLILINNFFHINIAIRENFPSVMQVALALLGAIAVVSGFPKKTTFGFYLILFAAFWYFYQRDYFGPYNFVDFYPVFLLILGISKILSAIVNKIEYKRLVEGLCIGIPSYLWLMNNTVWDYKYPAKVYIGLFLVFLGIYLTLLYFIKEQEKQGTHQ